MLLPKYQRVRPCTTKFGQNLKLKLEALSQTPRKGISLSSQNPLEKKKGKQALNSPSY